MCVYVCMCKSVITFLSTDTPGGYSHILAIPVDVPLDGYGFEAIWSGKGYDFQAIWSGIGSSNCSNLV